MPLDSDSALYRLIAQGERNASAPSQVWYLYKNGGRIRHHNVFKHKGREKSQRTASRLLIAALLLLLARLLLLRLLALLVLLARPVHLVKQGQRRSLQLIRLRLELFR